jgi:hypothetical protein
MYPSLFLEVVGDEGLIFLRVRKMPKSRKAVVEKKGVKGRRTGRFCKVSEVAANKGLRGFFR